MDVNSRDPSQNIIPFRIKGVDVARFDTAGNLGIGTTTPATTLDVSGSIICKNELTVNRTTTNVSHGYVTLVGGSIYNTGFIEFRNANTSRLGYIGWGDSNIIYFHVEEPKNIQFSTSSIGRMWITASGDVGIGTSAPGEKLNVRGNLRLGSDTGENYIAFSGTPDDPGYTHTYIGERVYSGGNSELLLFKGNDGPDRIRLIAGEIRFDTFIHAVSGTFDEVATSASVYNRMTIAASGDVGIGTSNPKEKLDVRGNLILGSDTGGKNYIAFRGTTDDGIGWHPHTYIGEREYSTTKSELLLFKGNDVTNANGPDRIRLVAGEIRFETFDSAVAGTFDDVATSASVKNRMTILDNGNVGIGTTAPTTTLDVAGNVKISGSGDKELAIVSTTESRTRYYVSEMIEQNSFSVGRHLTAAFLWNYANTSMAFATNNTQRMTITANGDVGIGTSAPTKTLDVWGNIICKNDLTVNRTSTAGYVTLAGGSSTTTGLIEFMNADTSRLGYIGWGDSSTIYFHVEQPKNIQFSTSSHGRMWITASGDVGIGTATPITKLHVRGENNLAVTTKVMIENPAGGVNTSGSDYVNTQISLGSYGPFIRGVHLNGGYYTDSMRLDLCTNQGSNDSTPVARISILSGNGGGNGNVGIGTTAPTAKLHIAGDAKLTGDLNMMSTGRITNLVEPVAAQNAATKNYVDNLDPNVKRDDSIDAWHALTFIPISSISNTNMTTLRGPLTVSRLGGNIGGLCYLPSGQTLVSPKISTNNLTVNSGVAASTTYLNVTNPGHLGTNAANNTNIPYVSSQIALGSAEYGPFIRTVMDPNVLTHGYRFEICTYRYLPPPGSENKTIALTIPQAWFGDPRVGIGTTTPATTLDVSGSIICKNDLTVNRTSTAGYVTLAGGSSTATGFIEFRNANTSRLGYIGWGDLNTIYFHVEEPKNIQFSTSSHGRMWITASGDVGIGTSSPQASLHVSSYKEYQLGPSGFYWEHTGGSGFNSNHGTSTRNISIISEQSILIKGHYLFLTSDQRIKTNIVNLNSDKMINVFRHLRPISFDYIDPMKNYGKKHFGFIAQEVNEILPEGISLNTDVIPNNMKKADISKISETDETPSFTLKPDDTDITLQYLLLTTDSPLFIDISNSYSSNDTYKFKVYCGKEWAKEHDIYIRSDYNVTDDKYTYVIGMKKEAYDIALTEPTLFVYGQYVYDLHILDHDTIYTVATAALQEVDRQQQADKARIAELEATVSAQQSLINDILERLKKIGA